MSALFGWLAEGLKYIMIFCDKIAGHHYWLSLLLFALIIKLLLFPFGIKQQKNQQKLALLRPKEEAIRRKYKGRDDRESRQRMQQEIMEMYQREKYSQFGGCLPMLLQLPIIFSLYYIVQNPLHYICRFGNAQIEVIMETFHRLTNYSSSSAYQNLTIGASSWLGKSGNLQTLIDNLPVDGTIPTGATNAAGEAFADYAAFRTDLVTRLNSTAFPKFNLGFIDLSVTPSSQPAWYILIPIVTFLILWLTFKIQKKFTYQSSVAEAQQGASTKVMEFITPAISAVFAYSLPTALAFYWVYQNILGFGQQVLLSKLFPTHKMTDAEVREAMREADRLVYEQKKAEEKRKKIMQEEEAAVYANAGGAKGAPEGWVEPMGPSSHSSSSASNTGKGKKNSLIGSAEIKDDKKDDGDKPSK